MSKKQPKSKVAKTPERPEKEPTIKDLEIPEKKGADVKGGLKIDGIEGETEG